jgi:hypothetical protein
MAAFLAEPRPRPTVAERVYAAAPLSPLWVGLGFAAVLFLLYLVTGELAGALDFLRARGRPLWQVPLVREAALLSVLFSYALTAEEMAKRSAQRFLEETAEMVRWSAAELQAAQRKVFGFPVGRRRLFAAGGVLLGALITRQASQDALVPWLRGEGSLHLAAWDVAFNIGVCLVFARGFYLTFHLHRTCAGIGTEAMRIDLVDPSARRLFTRLGLRGATLWVVAGSLAALLFLNWGFSVITSVGVVGTLGAGTMALLLPLRGVHVKIRATKRAELARVDEAVRRDREAVLDPSAPRGAEAAARLPALLAWRAHVVAIPEWPFDVPTLVRVGLLLLLALGSWLGGAMVERLLGVVLD